MAAELATFFHRTGTTLDPTAVQPVAAGSLRPVLFANFHDLTRLRYDFPLVLAANEASAAAGPPIETLSGRVDAALTALAPDGPDGDRMRRLAFAVEREIRAGLAAADAGTEPPLEAIWDAAAERVAQRVGEPDTGPLAALRGAVALDGCLIDCHATAPATVVEHVWRGIRDQAARERLATIDALARRLAGLVEADFVRSAPGRSPALLRGSLGGPHRDLFDFEAMAGLLAGPSGPAGIGAARRQRVEAAVDALREQRFFGPGAHDVVFDDLESALEAQRARLPEMARLVAALALAELELRGGYVEAEHDAWFRDFGPEQLRPEDAALFPPPLVLLDGAAIERQSGALLAALAGDMPLKVVLSFDDPQGLGGQLAESAIGLGEVFVLQVTASQLHLVRDRLQAALAFPGPALISVFTGATRADLPPYLVAAAALEARVVPSFTCDPAAGPDFADRFALHDNPQPERPWPIHDVSWADAALQRVTAEIAFTPADYAICDPRHAAHLARVPTARWSDRQVVLERWQRDGAGGTVPFILAVDASDALVRLVVDERLTTWARRRGEAWHRLQELDALKRPPAATLDSPPAAVDGPVAPPDAPIDAPAATASPEPPSGEAVASAEAAPAAVSTRSRDDAWIETARCTTCNECTGVNPRMFAYNANGQATIADLSAGTYRDLVEAAERCQVAIIHPGKPRDAAEPGLDDLLARAEPFR